MNVGKAGLANIGPKETRKRLLMGVSMLAVDVVLAFEVPAQPLLATAYGWQPNSTCPP